MLLTAVRYFKHLSAFANIIPYFINGMAALSALLSLPVLSAGQEDGVQNVNEASFFSQVSNDYQRYYTNSQFSQMLFAFSVAGLFANTSLDTEIRKNYTSTDSGTGYSNELFEGSNNFGDYSQLMYALPLYLGTMWLGSSFSGGSSNILQTWGNRSLRTLLLGAPQQLVLSYVTGANRPEEGGSSWDPFNDNNGVSGHAFFGAVPLITAARMSTNKFARYSFYVASTLPGLARVDNNKHYLSQALLGWSLAYFSSDAVFSNNSNDDDSNVRVYNKGRDIFLGLELKF